MGRYFPRTKKITLFLFISMFLLVCGLTSGGKDVWSTIERIALEFSLYIDTQTQGFPQPVTWIQRQDVLAKKLLQSELYARQVDAKLSKLEYVQKENDDLRASLATVSGAHTQWIPAHFLSFDGESDVDVGLYDGVYEGAMVVSRGVYVGTLWQVDRSVSHVREVISPDSRIGVRTEPSGVMGVLTQTSKGLTLTCISRFEDVHEGDIIQTIGDAKGNEAGILVGYIAKDLTRTADPVSSFLVKPALQTTDVRVVLVHKGE